MADSGHRTVGFSALDANEQHAQVFWVVFLTLSNLGGLRGFPGGISPYSGVDGS